MRASVTMPVVCRTDAHQIIQSAGGPEWHEDKEQIITDEECLMHVLLSAENTCSNSQFWI